MSSPTRSTSRKRWKNWRAEYRAPSGSDHLSSGGDFAEPGSPSASAVPSGRVASRPAAAAPAATASPGVSAGERTLNDLTGSVAMLRSEVDSLRSELDRLRREVDDLLAQLR